MTSDATTNNNDLDKHLVLPKGSPIFQLFESLVRDKRVLFVAGLPAVGKSLYLQQLVLLAAKQGRPVHLLQWDVVRACFEQGDWLSRYPEVDGVTHPAIRKVTGLWSRQAVANWHSATPDSHLLISELPLIGNRLVELVQQHDDEAEKLLGSAQTHVVVPVPSQAVRTHLEQRRHQTISNPQHERERADAPPAVVEQLWRSVYQLAVEQGVAQATQVQPIPYDATAYSKVFSGLLKHRVHDVVHIDTVFPVSESVYSMSSVESELSASADDVDAQYATLDANYSAKQLQAAIDHWWKL